MATIRKRKWTHAGEEKEAWILTYTDNRGKRRQKTFNRRKDADAYRLNVEVEVKSGFHIAENDSPVFDFCCEQFLKDAERRHKFGDRMSGHTLESLKSRVTCHIIPRFGWRRVAAITADEVDLWVQDLRPTHKATTINAYVGKLFSILDFCVRRKWIRRNPLRDQPVRLSNQKKIRPRIPTKAEISAILNTAWTFKDAERPVAYVNRIALVSLAIFGGLRVGEITGLQWKDVDFAAGVIHVRHSLSKYDGLKAPKTHAGERDIPLSEPIRAALCEVLNYWQKRNAVFGDVLPSRYRSRVARRRLLKDVVENQSTADLSDMPSGYIIMSTNRAPMTGGYHSQIWAPLMRAAGLADEDGAAFSFHKLRHAAASLFIEAGLPAMNLKTIMGHENVTTTYNVYGHLFPEDQRVWEASMAIGAQFSATLTKKKSLSL